MGIISDILVSILVYYLPKEGHDEITTAKSYDFCEVEHFAALRGCPYLKEMRYLQISYNLCEIRFRVQSAQVNKCNKTAEHRDM